MDRMFAQMHQNSSWILPGGLAAQDEEDQRRLEGFLSRHPAMHDACVEAIRNSTSVAGRPEFPAPSSLESDDNLASPDPLRSQLPGRSADLPRSPMRLQAAIKKFVGRRAEAKKSERTTVDQAKLIQSLCDFLTSTYKTFESDPWVHQIDTHHIDAFVDARAQCPGKHLDEEGNPAGVKASTLKKKLLDLGLFFSIASDEFQACLVNPVAGLACVFRRT